LKIFFEESSQIIKNSMINLIQIEASVKLIQRCLKNNRKVILFGNGGSAAVEYTDFELTDIEN